MQGNLGLADDLPPPLVARGEHGRHVFPPCASGTEKHDLRCTTGPCPREVHNADHPWSVNKSGSMKHYVADLQAVPPFLRHVVNAAHNAWSCRAARACCRAARNLVPEAAQPVIQGRPHHTHEAGGLCPLRLHQHLFWDLLPMQQKLDKLVGEVVAIPTEDVVAIGVVIDVHIVAQELQQLLTSSQGHPQLQHAGRLPEGDVIHAGLQYRPTKPVFLAESSDAGMPDPVELVAAQQRCRNPLCSALGEVVHGELDRVRLAPKDMAREPVVVQVAIPVQVDDI
mmetsp:Transcript_50686/g.114796  ORF Transcript_50686/g.114796 Transcript_50686/m.114796 type:complete len:282 (-) Transcript_50686:638-1483(-)